MIWDMLQTGCSKNVFKNGKHFSKNGKNFSLCVDGLLWHAILSFIVAVCTSRALVCRRRVHTFDKLGDTVAIIWIASVLLALCVLVVAPVVEALVIVCTYQTRQLAVMFIILLCRRPRTCADTASQRSHKSVGDNDVTERKREAYR